LFAKKVIRDRINTALTDIAVLGRFSKIFKKYFQKYRD